MFWMLVCVGGVAAVMFLSGDRDGMDYRAREARAAMVRRDAVAAAQMRRIRWERRREDLLARARWTRATHGVARA